MDIKFVVDNNVGKLAKWLRILGYDTIFVKDIADNDLIRIALTQNRIILTRDTQIIKRRVVTIGRLKAILIKDDDLRAQLRQVVTMLKLNFRHQTFSLCLECNQPLVTEPKEKVKSLVPPYVFQTQDEFVRCPHCGKIYWQGTHVQQMERELERLEE